MEQLLLTCTLHQQADDIAGDECLGNALTVDDDVVVPVCDMDNATQDNVYRGRKQGGTQKNEDALDDVRHDGPAACFLTS